VHPGVGKTEGNRGAGRAGADDQNVDGIVHLKHFFPWTVATWLAIGLQPGGRDGIDDRIRSGVE
jgi:hypothetical protein